jgi:ferredoxin-NADP reductase
MARAAVLGRLTWRPATVAEARWETDSARTLVLDVPGWPGHLAGQHVDLRLTSADGYAAVRSYSIASAAAPGAPNSSSPAAGVPGLAAPFVAERVELTVQRVEDGEVSSYLVDIAEPGDQMELRGPIGGYFAWRPENPAPVLLLAGGSGIVPLMAMIRARARSLAANRVPFRLIYSSRSPAEVIYAGELRQRVRDDHGLDIRYVYTREVPENWPAPPRRLDPETLAAAGWPAEFEPLVFVCGPTGFVEEVAVMLVEQGHPPANIKTERFG